MPRSRLSTRRARGFVEFTGGAHARRSTRLGDWTARLLIGALVLAATGVVVSAVVLSAGGSEFPVTRAFGNPDRRIDVVVPDAPNETIAADEFAPVSIEHVRATAHRDRFEIDIVFGAAIEAVPVHGLEVGGGNDPVSGNPVVLRDQGVVVNRLARHATRVDDAGNAIEDIAEERHEATQAAPVEPDDRRIEISVDGQTAKVVWELGRAEVSEVGGPEGRWKFRIAAHAETEHGRLESDAVLTYADGGWDF